MPDEAATGNDVQTALDYLLTYSLDYPKVRHQNYQFLLNAIHNDDLDIESVKKLLKVCVQDISTTKYTTTIIKIILAISSKVKVGKYVPAPDMTPTALAVISMIKTLAPLSKVEALMTLCFDTLLAYPEDTLIAIAEHHNDILEVFNLYCNVKIPIHIRLQACNLLLKLLKILPPEKKRIFVQNGILIWFSKIIPYHMVHITSPLNDTHMTLQVLELLAEELVHIDYTHVPPWHSILECICNTKQYPAVLKSLLMSENDAWQRLWIVFIKLLKHQITQSQGVVGTPINSMLPVVETAFKLDVKNRCKAFECWNVLIDSFSTETNESNINKRIKLLIIPLKSNNAKHEETALAKFKCWWHLIRKFQNKMDKFLDVVLISFLNFCFGRHTDIDKASMAPGQISASLKSHCNQAIVDMIGHVNCEGCTELPQLTGKLINTKRLVDNWNHWIYSITFVIMKTAKSDVGLTKQQMTCVWKSFLMTIGELPENNIRKDLFSEILSIVNRFVQECKSNNQFLDIAFNILILSLFDEDTQIKQLFKSGSDANDPIVRIVSTILDSSLNEFYKSLPPTELMTKLKPVTKLIVNERVCISKQFVNRLLVCFPSNDVALMLWNELAEALQESKQERCMQVTHNMLMWPLKALQKFTEVQIPAITWYKTYNEMYQKLNKTEIDKEISEIILLTPDAPISNVYFKLCVMLAVLKQKFTEDNCENCENEINQLLNLTKMMDSYENFKLILPMLVDRIVAIMTVVTKKVNDIVTALILVCVKNALHVLIQACKQQNDGAQILLLIGNLLKPLENLFVVESYSKLIPAMTYHLLKCSPVLCQDPSMEKIILSIMKTILSKTPTTDTNYNMIKALVEDIQNNATKKVLKPDPSLIINNFPIPQTKEVPKRIKKEASIVNTVVENGEEYVVVKSNWKFNPRKLTENQKEKLQRKREDIPALYQDLSQSQDEFKLVAWKTDSQDTTSSSRSESKSSKPGDNDTATEILKNLPNTDVVPKIFENILAENEKRSEVSNAKDSVTAKDNLSIKSVSTPSPKNTKSPRMALKDRVFRNVRNLMESSGLQKENQETNDGSNKTDSILKTPTNSKNHSSAHLVNSAPPLLSADRPSRVKRKPKKFEDLALLTTKKRRFSQHDSQKEHSSDSGQESTEKDCDNIATIQSSSENEEKTNRMPETSSNVDKVTNTKDDETMETTDSESNKINENRVTGTGNTEVLSSESAKVLVDDEIIVMKPSEQSVKDVTNVDPAMDVDEPLTDETPKTVPEESALVLCAHKEELATTKVSKDLKEVASPKITRASSKEILNVTSTATKDAPTPKASIIKEVLSPKKNKVVKEVAAPKQSEVANEAASIVSNVNDGSSTPKTSKDRVVATPKAQNKEVSTPKTTKAGKKNSLIATKDGKEMVSAKVSKVVIETIPITPKDLKEVATPKASKGLKEASTTKRLIGRNVSTFNLSETGQEANEVASKNVKEASSDITKEVNEASKALKIKEISTPKMANTKEVNETSTPKTPKNAKEISTPKMANTKEVNETSTPKAPKIAKEISTPKMANTKEVNETSTPKAPKIAKELSTPKMANTKEVNETSIPKAPKIAKEISTSKMANTKEVNEKATPKVPKVAKEILTPKMANTKEVNETSTPKAPKIAKEISTLKMANTKEVNEKSTPKVPTIAKEISTPKMASTKEVNEASTPKAPKNAKEISTPKIANTNDVNEASTPKAPKNAKEISTPKLTNIKEITTPKSTKQAKDESSLTISKNVKITPKLLENVMVMLNQESNIVNQNVSTPKNNSELTTTTKAAKELRETRSSKSPKDLKEESTNMSKEVSTPKQSPKIDDQKSTTKKVKKSRIEKELAIDMVEGHPFLKNQTEKRLTRKTLEAAATGRRKSLADKLNKSKSDNNSAKKSKDKNKESETTGSVVVDESQEKDSEPKENNSFSDELPYSDDVIESSQDSTITTISVKSTRKTPKKVPVVCVEKIIKPLSRAVDIDSSQSILEPPTVNISKPSSVTNHESKDDSVLPLNKTAVDETTQADLTENMDTEPIDDNDVVLVNADVPAITVCVSDGTIIGPETQEMAEADTQPTEPKDFMDLTQDDIPGTSEKCSTSVAIPIADTCGIGNDLQCIDNQNKFDKTMDIVNSTANNTTVPLTESARAEIEQDGGVSSPYKDEARRQQDFLNNTIEISPIKTMSPERHKKSPSPETSSDYVVIKLTSPVHSNGEPFEKCSSPEVFTEDKVSPDKRDQSPPRVETSAAVTSPSSSLSLKKNRPQVRSGGRAAQMLGLCVPDRIQAIVNPERSESDEIKKSSTNTPARRNLRILYNSVNDNTESSNSNSTSENDDSENFLKFRRTLPTVASSPSAPILKRKLADIADDATVSPASKRKRVSFHDPPVSTTISVQKYIEPIGVRSPQNSALKRLERQMRQHTPKSPKRLDNAFKLDTVLTKTVESFSDSDVIVIADDNEQTQQSLDETPIVEIVRASELNDTDPICSELLDCKDPIGNIAGELSSAAMKTLLIKELEGKIETVGDLAKMTELEVNRLCIKAPKVKVAKKVLTEYASKRVVSAEPEISETINVAEFDEPMTESEVKVKDMEVQTQRDEMDVEMQTVAIPTRVFSAQTEIVPTAHTSTQTNESGSKSSVDIIKSCLVEKPDFVEQLSEQLEESSIQQISEKLSLSAITDLLMKKITPSDTKDILERIFERNSSNNRSKELPFIREYLCGRFGSKDLILLCSQILKVVHDKPT